MVRSSARILLAAVAGCLCLALAAPAFADVGGYDPGPGSHHGAGPGNQSGSGSPTQKAVKTCSLYATSSNFGMSCITGSSGDVTTVKEILGKDPVPTCWDDRISDADLASKYQYTQNPDAPYYLHTCITGLQLDNSLYYQPDAQLNQQVIEIPKDAKPCPRPFTADMTGKCVMWLTHNQHQVVSATQSRAAQIPGITITTQPSTKIRTNEDIAYVDAATDENGNRITRTPDYQVGGVTMWGQLNSYKIYPYGPDGPSYPCNGTEQVGRGDTRQTKPDACWWTYPQSSARQPNQVYPFRAEADWTVYYSTGGAAQVLAQFQKYDDLTLPVYDIQTLVVGG